MEIRCRNEIYNIDSVDIFDVLDKLGVSYTKKSGHYWANCIWHNDSHPSMLVGGKKNIVHCFSCGKSADAVGVVMQVRNCGYREAREWLWPLTAASPPALSRREGAAPLTPTGGVVTNARGGKEGRKGWYRERLERIIAPRSRIDGETPVHADMMKMESLVTDTHSSFAQCLATVFGYDIARSVVEMYRLGRRNVDDVAFPNIDIDGTVAGIKVQGYCANPKSDRFFHRNETCYWEKSKSQEAGERVPTGRMRGSLFGEHLLPHRPDDTVVLVESPKNACVGAAAYPQYVWVATGNKNMLKREVLEVLRGRRVVVFPDADAVDEWSEKLEAMKDIAVFLVMQSPGAEGKSDIADWIINGLMAKG